MDLSISHYIDRGQPSPAFWFTSKPNEDLVLPVANNKVWRTCISAKKRAATSLSVPRSCDPTLSAEVSNEVLEYSAAVKDFLIFRVL